MSVGGFDVGGFVSDFAGDFVDFASDFAGDFLGDFAGDFAVDTFVDGFGTEFLTDIGGSFMDFGGEIFSGAGEFFGDIGGSLYEQVGSFAGNADWFNATSFGSILDSASAGFTEFFGDIGGSFSGITNYLPNSISSAISNFPDTIGNFISGIPGNLVNGATNIASNLVNTGIRSATQVGIQLLGNATGINPNLIPGFGGGGVNLPGIGSIFNSPGAASTAGYGFSIPGFGGPVASIPGFGSTAGYGFSLPGFAGVPVSTQGFGTTTGYGTPGFGAPLSGFSLQGAVDSALTFLTGSGTAQAQGAVKTRPTPVPRVENILNIDITGVGVNLGNNIALDPTKVAGIDGGNFYEYFNPETGLYDIYNADTNETVQTGLSQQEAIIAAQDLSIGNTGTVLESNAADVNLANFPGYDEDGNLLPGYELDGNEQPFFVGFGPTTTNSADVNLANFPGYDEDGNLLPGYQLDEENNPVFVGFGSTNTGASTNTEQGNFTGLLNQARQQATIREQRQNQAQSGDWRVRLRLAPQSTYLYNAYDCGPVLWPLRQTDGVIFPYTPTIDTAYKANYDAYDLTHSNYRGYFYKGSNVDQINLKATFTAQDTTEANYLLAVIHFFRSVTKMFYGQDAERGAPPPMTYLSGFGEFQFNEHPCVISQFNYSLPGDVDYIRAQVSSVDGTNLLRSRDRQSVASNPLSYSINRLASVFLNKGALDNRLGAPTLGLYNPTYVPTKIDINLTLLPMQSRQQISQQFSLKNFANGNLLKGGFW